MGLRALLLPLFIFFVASEARANALSRIFCREGFARIRQEPYLGARRPSNTEPSRETRLEVSPWERWGSRVPVPNGNSALPPLIVEPRLRSGANGVVQTQSGLTLQPWMRWGRNASRAPELPQNTPGLVADPRGRGFISSGARRSIPLRPLALGALAAGASLGLNRDSTDADRFPREVRELIWRAKGELLRFRRGERQANFSYGRFLIEAEFYDRPDRERLDLNQMLARYAEDVAGVRAAFNGANGDFRQKLSAVRLYLDRHLKRYCRERGYLTNYFDAYCGNCESQTKLILSLLRDAQIPIPDGFRLGAQLFQNHIQPVLHEVATGKVLDLMTGNEVQEFRGPIYQTELILWAYLNAKADDTIVSRERHLLLQDVDRKYRLAEAPTGSYSNLLFGSGRARVPEQQGSDRRQERETYDDFRGYGEEPVDTNPAQAQGQTAPRSAPNLPSPEPGVGDCPENTTVPCLRVPRGRLATAQERNNFALGLAFGVIPIQPEPSDTDPNNPLIHNPKAEIAFRTQADLDAWNRLDGRSRIQALVTEIRQHADQLARSRELATIRRAASDPSFRVMASLTPAELDGELLIFQGEYTQFLREAAGLRERVLRNIFSTPELNALPQHDLVRGVDNASQALQATIRENPGRVLQVLDRLTDQGRQQTQTFTRMMQAIGARQQLQQPMVELSASPRNVRWRRPVLRPGEVAIEIDMRGVNPLTPEDLERMRRQAQNPGQSNRSVNPEEEEEVRAREARIYVRPNTLFQILSTSEYDDGAMQDFGQRWDRELADYLEDLINVENFAIPRSLALNFMSSLHRVPLNEEIETRPDGSRFRRYSLGWSSFQESYASEALQEILVKGQRLMQSDGRPLLLPETLANLYVRMARSANPNNTTTIMPYRPERLPNETPRVAESRQELDHVAHLRWIRSPNDEELAWMDRRIMGHLFCLSREQGSSCRYFPNPNTGEQIEIQRDVAFMNIRDLYERHGRWAYDITDPDTIRLLRETIERVDRRYGLIPAPPRIESAVPLPGTPPPAPAPRRPLPVPLPPPQTTQQQQQTQAPRREQQQTQPPRRQNSPNARNLESMRGREWSGGNSFRLKCYSANEARTNGIDCALFDRNSSRVQTMTLSEAYEEIENGDYIDTRSNSKNRNK